MRDGSETTGLLEEIGQVQRPEKLGAVEAKQWPPTGRLGERRRGTGRRWWRWRRRRRARGRPGTPTRLAVVGACVGDGAQTGAVGVDGPDRDAVAAVGAHPKPAEGDLGSVGRPGRELLQVAVVGYAVAAPRRRVGHVMVAAAVLVHHPDVAVARLAAARAALVGDLRSIRRPGGKLVIAARRDRVHVRPVVVHDHQPVVGVVGDDDLTGSRPADRSLVLEFAGGDDVIPGSVDVDDPDLVQGIPVCSLQIGDPRSIRRPGRRGDVAIGAAGQLAQTAAVGVHDPDVPGPLPIHA